MFLKTSFFAALSLNKHNEFPPIYWVLALLRVGITCIPETGYIHPDEYFQNVEVISGDIFNVEACRTWEFNVTFPIRNILLPKLVVGIPYVLLNILHSYIYYYFDLSLKSPYMLLVFPRFCFCILSFVNDYCIYQMSLLYGQNYKNRLMMFASSYIVFAYSTRTFSNSLEMIFFSSLLLLVARCMHKSDMVIHHKEFLDAKYNSATNIVDKVKAFKLKTQLPGHSFQYVFLISFISVVGVFNRPTFFAFAMPPVFFWLQRGLGSKTVGFKDFHFRILSLIFASLPIILLLILIDSQYYGYFTLAELESMKISLDNFVVTPLNFLKYNLITENLASHCLHPRWLHFLVNVPLLFGILGLIGQYNVVKIAYRFIKAEYKMLPRLQSITGMMLSSFVTPIILLSIFPHQEPRFIIPLLIPLVFLYGNILKSDTSDDRLKKKLKTFGIAFWYLFNAVLLLFFGFVHQGGIYPLINSFHKIVKHKAPSEHIHLVTSHTYSLPVSLLQLPSSTVVWRKSDSLHHFKLVKQVFFYEYGSMPINELVQQINYIMKEAEKSSKDGENYNLYVAVPSSLEEEFFNETIHAWSNLEYFEEFSFYPHFSAEALPKFPSKHSQFCRKFGDFAVNANSSKVTYLNLLQRFICYLQKFSLKMYKVSQKKYS